MKRRLFAIRSRCTTWRGEVYETKMTAKKKAAPIKEVLQPLSTVAVVPLRAEKQIH